MTAVPGRVLPKRIGRFPVHDLVGSGSQGFVLLGIDPELGRRVAIKVLRPSAVMMTDAEQLIAEARITSQLQHPNVVTLHEVGEHHGLPYLVFEYVDGESLASLMARTGVFPHTTAVILMSQILSGVAVAHETGIVHRDLSPSNILVTKDQIPKVMDFGLSSPDLSPQDGSVRGTLRYMAPERLHGNTGDASSDVFALGAIFFEMLAGRPLIAGNKMSVVMGQLLRGDFEALIRHQPDIDPLIDKVVCKALHVDRTLRYEHARAMKDDLDVYRVPPRDRPNSELTGNLHASVAFLLRRMKYKKGFSVLSQRIADVQRLTAEHSHVSARQLSNIIAKDIVLTQRVLTTANSAYFGQRDITSVSRAIVLLGFHQVRMCITSAMLESHFGDNSPALQDALLSSFFSGILAKQLALVTAFEDRESVFVSSLFHNLGRTLVIHYFEDEYAAIAELTDNDQLDEISASRRILGVPYHEVGMEVAKAWKFPDGIGNAMRPLARGPVSTPDTPTEWLQRYAAFANAVARVHESIAPEQMAEELSKLAQRMNTLFTLSENALNNAISEAIEVTRKYARLMKLPANGSRFLDRLTLWEAQQKKSTDETRTLESA
ncbi:MAG: HDOD domain-containing protein [Gammaproteobacteria bacterium]